jgi:opacity protein-like surface antigen
MNKLITIILILLIPFISVPQTQEQTFNPHWYVSYQLGITQGWMDMSYQTNVFNKLDTDSKIAIGFNIGRQITPIFGIRIQGLYGKINTTNENLQLVTINDPVLTFNTSITMDIYKMFNKDSKFGLYGIIGVGVNHFNVINKDYQTNAIKYQDENVTKFVLPIGVGVSYDISQKFKLSFEYLFFFLPNNDLMDGYAGGITTDKYSTGTFNISYKFKNKKKKRITKHIIIEKTTIIVETVETPITIDTIIDIPTIIPTILIDTIKNEEVFIFYFDINSSEVIPMDLLTLDNIASIDVQTWASPDGKKSFNTKLSDERGLSLKNYLEGLYPTIPIIVTSNGENWKEFSELTNLTKTSDIIFKEYDIILRPLRKGIVTIHFEEYIKK